jgi:hypothetical protein
MCDWSNWQFICEGRYDILLALLAVAALSCSLALMLISFFGARYRVRHQAGRAFLGPRVAFLHGGADTKRPIGREQTKKP